MSLFTVQRKQVLGVSTGEWEVLYFSEEEPKARKRFIKSRSILKPGWRIQLLNDQVILEDETVSDPDTATSGSIGNLASSGGCFPGVDVYDNWIFPDEDFPYIPDRTC